MCRPGKGVDGIGQRVSWLLAPRTEQLLHDHVVLHSRAGQDALLLHPLSQEFLDIHLDGPGVPPGFQEGADLLSRLVHAIAHDGEDALGVSTVDQGDSLDLTLADDQQVQAGGAESDARDADAAPTGVVGLDAHPNLEHVACRLVHDLVGHPHGRRSHASAVVAHLGMGIGQGVLDSEQHLVGIHGRVGGRDGRKGTATSIRSEASAQHELAVWPQPGLAVEVLGAQVSGAELGQVARARAKARKHSELGEGAHLHPESVTTHQEFALVVHGKRAQPGGHVLSALVGDLLTHARRCFREERHGLHALPLQPEVAFALQGQTRPRSEDRLGHGKAGLFDPLLLDGNALLGDRHDRARSAGGWVVLWFWVRRAELHLDELRSLVTLTPGHPVPLHGTFKLRLVQVLGDAVDGERQHMSSFFRFPGYWARFPGLMRRDSGL